MTTTDATSAMRHDGVSADRRRNLYEETTTRIVAALNAGTPPWRCPWDAARVTGPTTPLNAVTGRRYRGINVLTLGLSSLAVETGDPRWATARQAETRGWRIRDGASGTTGLFYTRVEVPRADPAQADATGWHTVPVLRAFIVFHASQIDGIPVYVPPTESEAPWRAPEAVRIILAGSGATVRVGGGQAGYAPATDTIVMPPEAAFATAAGWCGTLLHELCHWTGAPQRLNRTQRTRYGQPDYAREELRAELGQVMLCAELGITDIDFTNNAAYVAGWLEALQKDHREIFRAAAEAQRIADYLLGLHPDYPHQAVQPVRRRRRRPERSASGAKADRTAADAVTVAVAA